MTLPERFAEALPAATSLDLAGRGEIVVWDTDEAGSAPTLVLLHGWNVDCRLNFAAAIPALADHFRLVMFDLHGHGSGHRSTAPFRIEHCAADVLLVADVLGIHRFTPVGYSLGGVVAQVLALRAPRRCRGLVLMATAARYNQTRRERVEFRSLAAAGRALRRSPLALRDRVFDAIVERACAHYPDWVDDIVLAADPVTLLEAGAELGRFDSRSWLTDIRIPSAVITTANDIVVAPERQRWLAENLPDALSIELPVGHDVPIVGDRRFGTALRDASLAVVERSS